MAKSPPKGTSDKSARIAELAEAIARDRDSDVLVHNFGMEPGLHYTFQAYTKKRQQKRKNLLFMVTTEGGDPNASYRIARCLQQQYATITIVVPGWCKSAGTLLCIAGNDLIVADSGELGPLDIQITKSDELGERTSGLTAEAAFEKLQEQSFELFFRNLRDIKTRIGGRITFRTAADIASQMAVGMTSDIFAKFDPVAIGEDHRANRIAEEYAVRLNLKANNLLPETSRNISGLEMLLKGYPSHSFVIDRAEAGRLFRRVSAPTGQISELLDLLGPDLVFPRSLSQDQTPRLEFLNAEKSARKAPKKPARRDGGARGKSAAVEGNAANVRRRLPPGTGPEPGAKEAA